MTDQPLRDPRPRDQKPNYKQLRDPRALTDGLSAEDCICELGDQPINPDCRVHNMTIQQEEQWTNLPRTGSPLSGSSLPEPSC